MCQIFVRWWTTVEASHVTQTTKTEVFRFSDCKYLFRFLAFSPVPLPPSHPFPWEWSFFSARRKKFSITKKSLLRFFESCDSKILECLSVSHTNPQQPSIGSLVFCYPLEAFCCIGTESTHCFYWDFLKPIVIPEYHEMELYLLIDIMILKLEAF